MTFMNIQMVDLKGQYEKIKNEIDTALLNCVASTRYIKGPEVKIFEEKLARYLNTGYAIGCGNGTDALQIAFMALGLVPGDEVIVPAFNYIAAAEALSLLGLIPVMADVDEKTFNLSTEAVSRVITPGTKAIVPVHLYGQSAGMEGIMELSRKYGLYVIEDNAQSLGATYTFSGGHTLKTGTIGHIGCHSFFPTKNLGGFGDGGALTTNDPVLAEKCRMIAAHGQKTKYYHEMIGCNSRLDTLQAAILNVKINYLDHFIAARQKAAEYYIKNLADAGWFSLPHISNRANHTFNQFTLTVHDGKRDKVRDYLKENGIPTLIYYPFPLYKQPAFKKYTARDFHLETTEHLCNSVLSIPMHTELTHEIQNKITAAIRNAGNIF